MALVGTCLGGAAGLINLAKDVYLKALKVKRFRQDCKKLADYVHRVEGFLLQLAEFDNVNSSGWDAAFTVRPPTCCVLPWRTQSQHRGPSPLSSSQHETVGKITVRLLIGTGKAARRRPVK